MLCFFFLCWRKITPTSRSSVKASNKKELRLEKRKRPRPSENEKIQADCCVCAAAFNSVQFQLVLRDFLCVCSIDSMFSLNDDGIDLVGNFSFNDSAVSIPPSRASSNLSYNLLSETEYLNQRLQLALSRFCSWRLSFCSDEFGAPQCIQITGYYCCCCCCLIMSCYLIFALASPQIHPFRKLAWKSRRVHESVESMIKTSSSGSANCYFNHHHQPTVNIHSICEVLGHRMSSHFMRSDRFTTANRQEKEESTRNSVHINGHDTWCHIS